MRTAFALEENVKLLAESFGINRLGFLTLTFADLVTSIKEAQRRFSSLRTHVLGVRYPASIAIVERGTISGRLHFHLLVVCPEDIRTGFNFGGCRSGDYLPGQHPGVRHFDFQNELARLLGRKVDLCTPPMLNAFFRRDVLEDALPVYEQARNAA